MPSCFRRFGLVLIRGVSSGFVLRLSVLVDVRRSEANTTRSVPQDVIATGSGTPRVFSPKKGPVDFVFFVDEKCEHVAEVLVHAWLDLHECSIEACLVGELLVGKASEEHTSVPGRLHQEIEETKPVDVLQVNASAF